MKSYYRRDRQLLYRRVSRIIWALVIIFLLQGVFQIKYLAITKIDLTGNQDLTREDVQSTLDPILKQRRFIFFKNNNFFLLSLPPLAEKLKQNYNLEEVHIVKKWPDRLEVAIKEKISHFVWQKEEQIYLLDARGTKIRPISEPDPKYLTLDDRRIKVSPQGPLFSAPELDLINQVYLKWQKIIGSQASLYKIVLKNDSDWELHTLIGYYVKIDSSETIETQFANLARILKAGNVSGVDINYIDLRFGDKVYFK